MSATIIDLAAYRMQRTEETASVGPAQDPAAAQPDAPMGRIASGMRGLAEALRELRALKAEMADAAEPSHS